MCQNSRTECSTAVCDSCVAQLGETDNPQPAGADKTATFLLRRLKISSAGPCSHSPPSSVPDTLLAPPNAFLRFQAGSSCPHYIPLPSSVFFISLYSGLQRTPEQGTLRLWAPPAVIHHHFALHLPTVTEKVRDVKSKHIHACNTCADRGTSF